MSWGNFEVSYALRRSGASLLNRGDAALTLFVVLGEGRGFGAETQVTAGRAGITLAFDWVASYRATGSLGTGALARSTQGPRYSASMAWIFSLRLAVLGMSMICVLLLSEEACAQPSGKPETPADKAPAAASTVSPSQNPAVVMPDGEKILLLIRTTLLTLNDALQTGNFTVLRDLAAPGFRDANTAGRLAQIFAPLLSQHVDLATVSILAPKLTEVPTIDPGSQMLHIKGAFPGQAVQINFHLLFQPVAGRWLLFGLSVNAMPSTVGEPGTAPAVKTPPGSGKAK
jgi:hypothetical protein